MNKIPFQTKTARPSYARYRSQILEKVLLVVTTSVGCTREELCSNCRKRTWVAARVAFTMTALRLFAPTKRCTFVASILPGKNRFALYHYLKVHETLSNPSTKGIEAVTYRDLMQELQETFPTPAQALKMISVRSNHRTKYEIDPNAHYDNPTNRCIRALLMMHTAILSEVSVPKIRSNNKQIELVHARIAVSLHTRRLFPQMPLERIGVMIGKHHATVLHGIKTHKEILNGTHPMEQGNRDQYLYINKELKRIFRRRRATTPTH